MTNTVKTMILVVVAGAPKPKKPRRTEGRKRRRDMQTRSALLLVAAEIGGRGKYPTRVSNAADPRTMMENRRG